MNHMLVLEFYQLDELLMVTVHGSGNRAYTLAKTRLELD